METKTKKINILGINRSKAKDSYDDGECQEIINMRLRDGAWRVRKRPLKIYQGIGVWDVVALHDQDNVRNYIGYSSVSGNLTLIDPALGSSTVIKNYATLPTDLKIRFLKRFLLVIGSSWTDAFLWNGTTYQIVSIPGEPEVTFSLDGALSTFTTTGNYTTAESLLGGYRAMILDQSNLGYVFGDLMIRVAYKLFDGTYIMHSNPKLLRVATTYPTGYRIIETVVGGGGTNNTFNAELYGGKVKVNVNTANFTSIDQNIVTSVVVFACEPQYFYQVDEDSITDAMLLTYFRNVTGAQNKAMYTANGTTTVYMPFSDEYQKMMDSPGWYKIHEIFISDIKNQSAAYSESIDLKGFHADYAIRETLPVDNFTHHKIGGVESMTYNDRLILTNIGMEMFGGHIHTTVPYTAGFAVIDLARPGYLRTVMATENGEIYTYFPTTFRVYRSASMVYYIFFEGSLSNDGTNFFYSQGAIGYPDSRATRIDILIDNGLGNNSYCLFGALKLTKSKYDNFAYYINKGTTHNDYFTHIFLTNANISTEDVVSVTSSIYRDSNRVQVSELKNPLVFLAKHSYQVGTGEIVGLGTNTEPMSDSQYGQYPIIVFTSKGILCLEQGSGDVLFAAISPVSGDVAVSGDQIINASTGVVFVTARGVFLILGKKIQEVSQLLEGQLLTDFLDNEHFKYFINDANLSQNLAYISQVDALTFISNAVAGFDKINDEIMFCNPAYAYSYVFSLETKTWHKVSFTFDLFINDYPFLLGVMQDRSVMLDGVYNNGVDEDSLLHDILIVTQPQSIGLQGIYKKIERTVLRCNLLIAAGTYFTYAIFASDDLITWQFITGGQRGGNIQNILTTRSHGSVTYWVFVLCGQVLPDTTISGIDITVAPRLFRKLRT